MATKMKQPPIPRQVLTLVDLDGWLALFIGTRLLADQPIRETSYRVSKLRLDGDATNLAAFVGLIVDRGSYAYLNGRYTHLPTDSWDWQQVERPIPKPKDGKDHTWVWVGETYSNRSDEREGWKKEPFPRCAECYESWRQINGKSVSNNTHHDPTWAPAECGQCHAGGVCDEKGYCRPIDEEAL